MFILAYLIQGMDYAHLRLPGLDTCDLPRRQLEQQQQSDREKKAAKISWFLQMTECLSKCRSWDWTSSEMIIVCWYGPLIYILAAQQAIGAPRSLASSM
jgi:hypothetical protein